MLGRIAAVAASPILSSGRQTNRVFPGTALRERRELRLAARLACGTRELRESNNDDAEFACQRLQVSRDRGDLLHTVFFLPAASNELQIVDDDHIDLLVRARAAGLRS